MIDTGFFDAFQKSLPLHAVTRIDAQPPWVTDLEKHRFFCRMCREHFTGNELAEDDRHVYVSVPCPGWELVECVACGETTVPTVEHSKKCDYCNGLQWWQVRELKEVL
ncbi:hypothetical protein [Glycomyces tarimensis]